MKRITSKLECKTPHQKRVFLIEKFIKNTEGLNWALEMKMAKKLLTQFDWDFLVWAGPPYPTNSLLNLFTADAQALLKTKKLVWDSQQKKEEVGEINQEKIGEDKVIKTSPFKSLAEFLR